MIRGDKYDQLGFVITKLINYHRGRLERPTSLKRSPTIMRKCVHYIDVSFAQIALSTQSAFLRQQNVYCVRKMYNACIERKMCAQKAELCIMKKNVCMECEMCV